MNGYYDSYKCGQAETIHSGPAVYPDVIAESGQLTVINQQAGKVVVSTGQAFVWRGCWHVHTDDYTDEQRSFVLSANQIYHLRWQPFTGFVLCNLNDAEYNPEHQPSTLVQFDTSVDDMLIAEIVIDNNLRTDIRHFQNRQTLSAVWETGPLPKGLSQNNFYISAKLISAWL